MWISFVVVVYDVEFELKKFLLSIFKKISHLLEKFSVVLKVSRRS